MTYKPISAMMGTRTQDLIFTLYGDHIIHQGGTVWIGSLVKLLGTLGTSEQAVRSTASRMARKGWLKTEKQGRNSYYSLTPKATDLLSRGARQIFSPPQDGWDGRWYMVTYSFTDDLQHVRHQLRRRLSWLGFGQLVNGTWIAPRNMHRKLGNILDELDIRQYVDCFQAEHLSNAPGKSLAARCWELDRLNRLYQAFLEKYRPQYKRDGLAVRNGDPLSLEYAFKQRFWLIHEYRYFPFHDPYLPDELLPDSWLGHIAADYFHDYHALLKETANAYVAQVMDTAP